MRKAPVAIDAAAECQAQRGEIDLRVQFFLGVPEQETLAEIGERRALLEPEIGGRDRAAGDAGDEIDALDQAPAALARRQHGLVHGGERAIGEGRGARAAAGKGKPDQEIVAIGLGRRTGRERRAAADREIDRKILHAGATREKKRERRHGRSTPYTHHRTLPKVIPAGTGSVKRVWLTA